LIGAQLLPSPAKPALQVQELVPEPVLAQVALLSQPPLFVTHGSGFVTGAMSGAPVCPVSIGFEGLPHAFKTRLNAKIQANRFIFPLQVTVIGSIHNEWREGNGLEATRETRSQSAVNENARSRK
jgi:hypothetical protein